jgi:hypothetical protein
VGRYVLDLWAERWRRREASGDMIIVRYADEFIVGFEHDRDGMAPTCSIARWNGASLFSEQ